MIYAAVDAPADAIKWTDQWTAIGTVLLFIATLGTVVVTIFLAWRDRRDAAKRLKEQQDQATAERQRAEERLLEERRLAEERVREERELANRRIREEREAADQRQFRERQINIASDLIRRISDLHPHLYWVVRPPLNQTQLKSRAADDAEAAIDALQDGARGEALMLGDPVGSQLYITLAYLVTSAHTGKWLVLAAEAAGRQLENDERLALVNRTELDVRRYSRYVRLLLAKLISDGAIPEEAYGPSGLKGKPDVPILNDCHPTIHWTPMTVPDGWWDDTSVDAKDPQFRPM
jgi:hypothetical protein